MPDQFDPGTSGHGSRSGYRKVTITLPPEHEAFLADFALELRKLGGRKLATTEIVRALILALKRIEPDLTEVKSEFTLAERIVESLNQPRGH